MRGDDLVAELVVDGPDFPWLNARVVPGPALAELRPLFDEEVELLNRMDDNTGGVDAWDGAYQRIRDAVRLLRPEGTEVPEFILHIEGDHAWWRWHDEPFDDEEA